MAHTPTVIVADQALRGYCGDLARESAIEYKYLLNAAAELRASLAPHSRWRAAVVSMHLVIAAKLAKSAMAASVDTYAKFLQQFGEDLIAAERAAAGKRSASTGGRASGAAKRTMNFGKGSGAARKPSGMTWSR